MFFFLSKILGFLIMPLSWIFSCLVIAFFLRDPRKKRRWLLSGLVLFYLFSNSFLLEEAARLWEMKATRYEDLSTYEAGIVLGGMLNYDETYDRIQFQRGADRLLQAIELYKMGKIRKIFFVGGSGSIEFAHIKEGVFVKRYLLTLGIPEEDIWIENESRNTYENAVGARAFLDKNGKADASFLLITSAHHMRRALACFEKAGLETLPYCVDRHASEYRRYSPDHLLIPDGGCFAWWNALIHEWIGLAVYKIRGYA